jgi:hypothetical protein
MSVNDYDAELFDRIEDLVAEGILEEGSPAFGVAQHVIHQGYASLTAKQKALYDTLVVPALEKRGEELRIIKAQNSAAP